jgi:UDP-2-acetamido-2,6-beta-L-arabino-hexul-4-ose reductase
MIKIGITGQSGFVGQHLYNTLGLFHNEFIRIPFEKQWLDSEKALDDFVSKCDVIVHLAAINRHPDPTIVFSQNIEMAKQLRNALVRTSSKAHIIFSSSTQEERNNEYGRAKKESRELLQDWANSVGSITTGLIIPNVFGPFGKPFYNSVVATFCHQVVQDVEPLIEVDSSLRLIYIGELVEGIIKCIREPKNGMVLISHTFEIKVSDILQKLKDFKLKYLLQGTIPLFHNNFDHNLFNTFRSFIDHANKFPLKYQQHTDNRGSFVELIRLEQGGQVSFSTTLPGITRGNHFHTRKIERFSVIKGKALIQLRKIGTNEVINFYLDGNQPAYVDMPVWYTHNIKNIGEDVLYTNFWINEPFDPSDPDTYFETV